MEEKRIKKEMENWKDFEAKEIKELQDDVRGIKRDASGTMKDVSDLKTDITRMKEDASGMRKDIDDLKRRQGENINIDKSSKKIIFKFDIRNEFS